LTDKTVEKNDKYKLIRTLIDNPRTLVQLKFLASVSPLFTRFLTVFQQEGPLVHVLHSSLCDLYRMLLLRFIRSECVNNKTGKDLKEIDVRSAANLRPLSEMDIGETTRQTLDTVKQEKHKGLLMDMQHFYKTCAESLRSSLPLASTLLQDLHCLTPQARSQPESENCIRRLAQKLPQVVDDNEVTTVLDEWKLYSVDDIPVEWQISQESNTDGPATSIDDYWSRVISIKNASGLRKYSCLGKVVRACLSLSHGNADVERSFSVNKKVVTADRVSLGQDTINALRIVKEAIRIQGNGQISSIAITNRMLQLARSAYSVYKDHLEKKKAEIEMKRRAIQQQRDELLAEETKKREAEEVERKKKRDKEKRRQLLKEIEMKQSEQRNVLKAAEGLLADAEKKLSDAIKCGDMCKVSIASGLLEVGRKRIAQANKELSTIAENKKMRLE
jgi:hypothetical protein